MWIFVEPCRFMIRVYLDTLIHPPPTQSSYLRHWKHACELVCTSLSCPSSCIMSSHTTHAYLLLHHVLSNLTFSTIITC